MSLAWYWWLAIASAPVAFLVTHTVIGLLLIPFYGIDKIRIKGWAIEIVAKTKFVDGKEYTKIWFRPGAQTWGFIIFYAQERSWDDAGLRVHERVHILQTILFGVIYPITYLVTFAIIFVIVKIGLGRWGRKPGDNDMWHAYRKIPWEIWAYAKQDKFNAGKIPNAWGS